MTYLQTEISFVERRRALGLSAICWGIFAIVAAIIALGWNEGLDRIGLTVWNAAEIPWPKAHEAVRDVTALGGTLVRNVLAVAAVLLLLALRQTRRAAWLGFTVIGGMGLAALLKLVFARPRPDVVEHLMHAGGTSFPSGHSFNAAVVFLAIALAFAVPRPARHLLVAFAVAVSLAVAWSRVWLGVHYPTDVIAGWLGGTGWVLLMASLPRNTINR